MMSKNNFGLGFLFGGTPDHIVSNWYEIIHEAFSSSVYISVMNIRAGGY